MYTCVYMYTHIRENKYMYIMIHIYVYIYTCGFSVCVWLGERVCVAIDTHPIWFIDTKNNNEQVLNK